MRKSKMTSRAISLVIVLLALPLAVHFLPSSSHGLVHSQDDQWKLQPERIQSATDNPTGATTSGAAYSLKSVDKSQLSTAQMQQRGQPVEYFVLNVEFRNAISRRAQFSDNKVSRIPGATVLTSFERFVDVFVSEDAAYNAIRQRADVIRVEIAKRVTAPPPPVSEVLRLESKAVPDRIVRGGHNGLTGKGVIIAVIDSGIDFRHPDFITYDATGQPTSRLRYLWDTSTDYRPGRGSPAPFPYPNKAPIGTLYTRDQLTAALRKEARGVNSGIPATDLYGHGTACAGIAAGNGNADRRAGGLKRNEVIGVAPEADIIGIRFGKFGLENGYLLNAAGEWLDTVAGQTPLVISCSFGGHWDGHDGQTVRERHLAERFSPGRSGRVIVAAAGNEGATRLHAEVTFGDQKNAKLIRWDARTKTVLNVYFDSADQGLRHAPAGETGYEWYPDLNPLTGQLSARVEVAAGVGGLWLLTESGRQTKAHLFFPAEDNYGPIGSFAPDVVSYNTLVGAPGSSANVITVGSYDWNDNFHSGGNPTTLLQICRNREGVRPPLEIGKISCYSSPGPTRLGKVKPEIVAPGQWFSASYAKLDNPWPYIDTSTKYAAMNGTSAATPYAAGIIALVFQKRPTLTLGEVRNLLMTKASRDPFTSTVPNNKWGYGKLDLPAVERIIAALN